MHRTIGESADQNLPIETADDFVLGLLKGAPITPDARVTLPSGAEVTGAEIEVFSDVYSDGRTDISDWLVFEPGSDTHKKLLEHLRISRVEQEAPTSAEPITTENIATNALRLITSKFRSIKRS